MIPRFSVSSVQHVTLAWFAMVMGLCGLSLAWHRAAPWWGDEALLFSTAFGVLAAVVLTLLVLAILYKAWRFPAAWRDDVAHPVRHVFVAAVPSSFILLSTVMVTLQGPSALADAMWMGGSACLFAVTVWVAQRWLRPGLTPASFWTAFHSGGGQRAAGLGGCDVGAQQLGRHAIRFGRCAVAGIADLDLGAHWRGGPVA
jgi:tellurite resistance protein